MAHRLLCMYATGIRRGAKSESTQDFREAELGTPGMNRIVKTFATALTLAGLAGTADASYIEYSWSDLYDPNPDLSIPPSNTYTHVLTDDTATGYGFRPLVDFIGTYSLSVNLYDDGEGGWFDLLDEVAIVNTPGSEGDGYFSFGLTGQEFGGWSLAGWLQLNLTGRYTVTIESLWGDFFFGASRIDARGVRAVPEPGTLALLAIGLIGMGVALSRRRNPSSKKSKE